MSVCAETESNSDRLGEPVDTRRGWRSSDFESLEEALTVLSSHEIEDLVGLAKHLPPSCSDWAALSTKELTTERLSARFGEIAHELGRGRGFALIRGLDAGDPELLRRMFWIIGNHLGEPVMQNARGEILSEVFDRFAGAPRGMDSRGYESNDELRFHCDGGDCIGLGCVRQSPSGGESGLVSLLAIYNELLAKHPEHLDALYRGFPLYVRKEKESDGASERAASVPDRRIPVYATQGGQLSAWLNTVLAEHAAEVTGGMDPAGRAALDQLEAIAERPDMKLRFRLQRGDLMWIHNLGVMHRRDLYQDDPDPKKKRLFYRMWTNLHEARDVVPEHAALRKGIRGPVPVIVGPN